MIVSRPGYMYGLLAWQRMCSCTLVAGVHLLLKSPMSDMLPTTETASWRVVVHGLNEEPFPDAYGMFAPAGMMTNFGVQYVSMFAPTSGARVRADDADTISKAVQYVRGINRRTDGGWQQSVVLRCIKLHRGGVLSIVFATAHCHQMWLLRSNTSASA